ncbi:hypothetical protein HMPREF9296_0171 [Prevotella disiens FB035-09AN]|uniref:Uncharacterized protein n=1 Tax=Prevotella disiens FB035-09AN TaxID=866771 RepID=E1KUC3_9BACT|nr:hypothetical protein HMPREF9296_0171 [Prevotella disiens FB035-09AN]
MILFGVFCKSYCLRLSNLLFDDAKPIVWHAKTIGFRNRNNKYRKMMLF